VLTSAAFQQLSLAAFMTRSRGWVPRALRTFAFAANAFLLCSLPSLAQQADPALSARIKPLVMNVDLVLVPVTVTDARNRPVLDLPKDRFELYEGEEPQQVQYFSHEDGPISIGVLLDLSKSMTNKIEVAREAVQQFFRASNPEDDYFVITFNNAPHLVADTTQSLGSIEASLAQATPAGRTALLDAIYLGIQKAHHAKYKRRALLIISDGGDNASRYSAKEIRRIVKEADVQIYAVGIFDTIFRTTEEWSGRRLLNEITGATGGQTATIRNVSELPDVAERIGRELRSQYVLGYRPTETPRGGAWRKIRVLLKSPSSAGSSDLQVRSKRGYLAPGE
jgi:Ca-activated chloride channel family protein